MKTQRRRVLVEAIRFEVNRLYRWLYPIMWALAGWTVCKKGLRKALWLPSPQVNSLLFDGWGKVCSEIKRHARSWRAIDLICEFPNAKPNPLRSLRFRSLQVWVGNWLDYLWLNSPNCQALRNRQKIVTREVLSAIWRESIHRNPEDLDRSLYNREEKRILSLACGSAKGILSALDYARQKGICVRALLVDIDPAATQYAMSLARDMGLEDCVEVREMNITVRNLRSLLAEYQPHIVEMIGFIDYLSDKKIVIMSRIIEEALPVNGRFLTATITPCPAQSFLRHDVNWDMVYRDLYHLEDLLQQTGFGSVRVRHEPWGIYAIAVCQKGARDQNPTATHFVRLKVVPATAGVVQ